MPAPTPVPEAFRRGPFLAEQLREAGASASVLEGRRFRRLLPRVWVHVDHAMAPADHLRAAQLALPASAAASHQTRLQLLGWSEPTAPLHFTTGDALHLALPGIVLHRTRVMPPLDDDGVDPAFAWVQRCATASLQDAVAIGDWLLHDGHVTRDALETACRVHPWRPGSAQALRVLALLDGRAASPPESRLRIWLAAAGLPSTEVNADVLLDGRRIAIVDLLFRDHRLAVEYEGRQHADDPRQFARDLQRYADLRRADHEYVQLTSAMMSHPRAVVLTIYRALRAQGYAGPAPVFGSAWDAMWNPIRARR